MLGTYCPLESAEGTLAFRRQFEGSACTVLVNFTGDPIDVTSLELGGATLLLTSDDPDPTEKFSGLLGPDQAVILSI